jgi:hypothetical protein
MLAVQAVAGLMPASWLRQHGRDWVTPARLLIKLVLSWATLAGWSEPHCGLALGWQKPDCFFCVQVDCLCLGDGLRSGTSHKA